MSEKSKPVEDLRAKLNRKRSRSANQADRKDASNSNTPSSNQSEREYFGESGESSYTTHQILGPTSGQNHNARSKLRRTTSTPPTRTQQPNKKRSNKKNSFINDEDRLAKLLPKDPSEIIMELLDDHKAFCEFLKCDRMSQAKSIEEILAIMSKLYETPHMQNLTEILVSFKDATFLKCHLQRYIFELSFSKQDRMKNRMHLERIIRLFNVLLGRFPNTCEDLPVDVLFNCVDRIINDSSNKDESDTSISAGMNANSTNNSGYNSSNNGKEENNTNAVKNKGTVDNITPQNTSNTDENQAKELKDRIVELKSLRDEILRQKHSPPIRTTVIKSAPPDDYKSIPVFPRREDIFPEIPPFLRKNIIDGRYTDVTHYLDVQFRLLREDYIAPIRDGVLEVTSVQDDRSRSIHVYKNVRVVGRLLDTKSGGLLHRVQFDISRMRRVNWKRSKRFKYGSLYCLIDSDTQSTMYFITITERNIKDLEKGFLNVKLFDDNFSESIPVEQQFYMIESPAYFESYRHVLEGLQSFNENNLPFQRYLVECTSQVRPPVYLVKATNPNMADNLEVTDQITAGAHDTSSHGCYDLREALACATATSVPVLDLHEWPSASQVDLNDSQYRALKAALTQEFVVIQGPPGTGKTFVGLRIANALLKNKSSWRRRKPLTQNGEQNDSEKHSPILVVCYTNHALDQFLEGILQITNRIARVGGRGKSKSLERFNLKHWKRMTKESYHRRDLDRRLKDVQAKIEEERSVIEAAVKDLRPKEVEDFLTKDEKEQLRQWERVAHQMRVHRIDAWRRMQDEADDGRLIKRKRSSSTSSQNDETKCNNSKVKRTRNTVNRTVLSEHANPSASQGSQPRIKEHGKKKKSSSFQEPNFAPHSYPVDNAKKDVDCVNQLEEGELPDSDDEDMCNKMTKRADQSSNSLSPQILRNPNETICNVIRPEENDVNLTIAVVPNNDGQDVINIKNERDTQDEIMDSQDSIMLEDNLGNSSTMFSSEKNHSERDDKEETIVNNEDDAMVIDKHSDDKRDKGKENESSMSSFGMFSCKKNHEEKGTMGDQKTGIHGGKSLNDENKVGESSKMSAVGKSDISPEDVEEGEIDDYVSDSDDSSKDNGEDDGIAPMIERRISLIRRGKENTKESVEQTSGVDDENRVGESSKMSAVGKSDIFPQDVEEGEIDDYVSDSDDSSKDNGEDDGIAPMIERRISLIRRGKENTKESVEQTCGVDEKAISSDVQYEKKEQMHQVDLNVLSKEDRCNLYQEWMERYSKHHREKLDRLRKHHDDILQQMSEIESIQNERILKDVDVIGMTTTGAAKHRLTLQEIKPRIMIVEEAAEVLEGHVITALSSGTDHLILIGDHKQLKPSPAVYKLAKKYKLDVSLFERMVRNGLTCHSLNVQHRMRPEIADIMRIIYPTLADDMSVQDYDSVTGIQQNVYFIDHNKPESENDELKSPSNQHEVEYVAALCQYLWLQGYRNNSITVLTMYTGQLIKLEQSMLEECSDGIRISSVDNYQGEESDIIILSLVRSNENDNIGFLNVPNRVCVALSRAKKAMYCIGNISMMAKNNKLWNTIKIHLQQKSMIGNSLRLYCAKHKKMTEASSAEDFEKAPQGGCMSPCEFRHRCGHACSLRCHPVDPGHNHAHRCTEKCLKELCDLKHTCQRQCHFGEECEPCKEEIPFAFPSCKHKIQIECRKRENIKCTASCGKKLPCHHSCAGKCGEDCNKVKCQTEVARTLKCGHTVSMLCSSDARDGKCSKPCNKLLDCGHKCSGNCSRCHQGKLHVHCEEPCKRLLVCSHECNKPCTKNCPPCEMPCEDRCKHSKCGQRCGKICIPCQMPCVWQCEHHQCTKRCGEMCDRMKCNEPCQKLLECEHQCVGICGDYCPRLCRICNAKELQEIFLGNEDKPNALYIELVDCNHIFEVNNLDYWMEEMDENENSAVQLKVCPKCKTAIRRSLRYGNIVKKTLDDIKKVKEIKLDEQRKLRKKRILLRERLQELAAKYPSLTDHRLEQRVHELASDADAYNTLENELKLFNCLGEIGEMFFSGSDKLSFVERSSKLVRERERFRELLHQKRLLTNQQVKDISECIALFTLSCQFQYMLWKIEDFNSTILPEKIISSIESAKEIMSRHTVTDEERAVVASVIEDVSREVGVTPLTPKERTSIVQALGLSKGHWYKCRNGHIYVITECGGAMESRKCPECPEIIGGRNHRVAQGNELASEMDGATHSAWSDQANLLNYDPEDIRQLQR